jgi:hypothetical protein
MCLEEAIRLEKDGSGEPLAGLPCVSSRLRAVSGLKRAGIEIPQPFLEIGAAIRAETNTQFNCG